jgi:hypothetical protein
VWGLDLLGPFKKVPGGLPHLLVAVDKLTKWIEVRPLAKIGSKEAVDFIQDIIFCFEVPKSINTDNITQFTGQKILDFCDDNNLCVDFAMVTHPHTNGQVKRANGMIAQGLKSCILTQEGKDVCDWLSTRAWKWVAEVPSIL